MRDADERYLRETRILDFKARPIAALLGRRRWRDLPEFERIGAAYDFVRNEIDFGYNRSDNLPASAVLRDGYGQCNTKANLLMALLRALEVPCRLHGFAIHKSLQRGIIPEAIYGIAPTQILHSWVEIQFAGRWVNLEGFILDDAVLSALKGRFADERQELCAYGVGTSCLPNPPVDWTGEDTYIQITGIIRDFGLFDSPDDFYAAHMQNFGPISKIFYPLIIRHWMNMRVRQIRKGHVPVIPGGPDPAFDNRGIPDAEEAA